MGSPENLRNNEKSDEICGIRAAVRMFVFYSTFRPTPATTNYFTNVPLIGRTRKIPPNPTKNSPKNAIFSACGGLNVLQTIPKMHFFVRVIRENILWCISFPFWSSVYQKSVIQREVFVWIVPKYFSFNEHKKDELVISKLRGKKTTQFIFCDWPIETPMTVTRKYVN